MSQLKIDQMQGEVSMISANNADDIKDELFRSYEGHKIPKHETHIYHVIMELRVFDTRSGQRKSKPRVNKYTERMFEFQKKHGGFEGYTVHVLHNPNIAQPVVLSLTDIKGVGQATKDALNEAGVKDVEHLAALENPELEHLAETHKFSLTDIRHYWEQAKKLVLG